MLALAAKMLKDCGENFSNILMKICHSLTTQEASRVAVFVMTARQLSRCHSGSYCDAIAAVIVMTLQLPPGALRSITETITAPGGV